MAIETVAQNAQSSFADPQNGTSPIDADEVTANDNALRAKHNTHDADATIHVQGSILASRPTAGTEGRKWMTRDAGVVRLFRDSGSAWEELAYIPTSSDAAITGIITFSTAPVFTNAQAFADAVTVGATLGVTGASTLAGVSATDVNASGTLGVTGAVTFLSTLGVTGAVTMLSTLGVTGAITAASFSGSGAGLTSLPAAQLTGTLPALSGANLTTLNATNLSSGTVATARLPTSYTSLSVTTLGSTTVNAETLRGGGSTDAQIKTSPLETYFLVLADNATATYLDTTTPTGSDVYLRISIGGVSYRILCKGD